ncbi:Hypothetical protein, putative [Bodo saltans]|uniref:Uncharacterized protein n=1 Tax=Bodo saltans TaxID=75058 RepID=A0A0S4JQ37_BODSA|nr:Hypothetical protein, putative [Bodo saltans]|eukprot:CUG92359.1 Hypothetical protein, putative [Bodo saltans]
MTEQATNENVQLLLTKLMTDRFCSDVASDFDACIQNFVPQKIDGSFVDSALQRKGLKKCEPYREAAHRCLQDDKRQSAIFKAAAQAPTCKVERQKLGQCQRKNPKGECEQEALEMVYCGMIYLASKNRKQKGQSGLE